MCFKSLSSWCRTLTQPGEPGHTSLCGDIPFRRPRPEALCVLTALLMFGFRFSRIRHERRLRTKAAATCVRQSDVARSDRSRSDYPNNLRTCFNAPVRYFMHYCNVMTLSYSEVRDHSLRQAWRCPLSCRNIRGTWSPAGSQVQVSSILALSDCHRAPLET